MQGWLLRRPEKMGDKSIQKIMGIVEKHGIDLKVVDPTQIRVLHEHNFAGKIYVGDVAMDVPDYIIAAFFTEKNYHTLSAIKMLEILGVTCINSYDCINNVDDKLLCVQKIAANCPEVLLPTTLLVEPGITAEFVSAHFTYPVVLKVMHGSKGLGVILVHTEKELANLLNIHGASGFGDEILIQEFIASSKGRDLRMIFCNGKFEQSFVRENGTSFRSNVAGGGSISQFAAPDSLIEQGEKIAALMGIAMGSVDFLFGPEDKTFYFCEANAMIGLSFDVEKEFIHLLEMVKNKPEAAWKKQLREGARA